MITGFATGGQAIIWVTLMMIGALLWEINKKMSYKEQGAK